MARAELDSTGNWLLFHCPGCDMRHGLPIRPTSQAKAGPWSWNGSLDRPTLTPSVLVRWDHGEQREERRCHSFVRDGRVEFLSDCTHALAGQTVDMAELGA